MKTKKKAPTKVKVTPEQKKAVLLAVSCGAVENAAQLLKRIRAVDVERHNEFASAIDAWLKDPAVVAARREARKGS